MLRYCLQLFPDASKTFQPLIITLAVIGIVYGAIVAIGQTDVMRLIAYTSISHFGFIILGIFAMTSQGQAGSTLYMVNHGISTAALFLIAGFLVSRRGTRLIADYGGVQQVAPVLAGTFLVAGLATLSLPGLAPFISEFLVLIGTFTRFPVLAVIAASALVLSAVYILWAYQRMMTGPVTAGNESVRDLIPRELAVVAPLIALLLVLGVYPKPALDVINPAVDPHADHHRCPGPGAGHGGRTDPMNIPAPVIEYGQLSPFLIVLGVAVLGVLVEAFLPRRARYGTQLALALGGQLAALAAVVWVHTGLGDSPGNTAAVGSLVVDRPALFLQGLLLLIGILGVLLIAERRIGAGDESGVGCLHSAGLRGAGQRRGEGRRESRCGTDRDLPVDDVRARRDAVVPGGRRSADHVRRSRGALAAAVSDVRAGPAAAPGVAGGGAQVLPARRVLLGVLPVRNRPAVRVFRRFRSG